MEKKPKPILSFDERFDLANAIKYVDLVVAQETYSPLPNVKKIKPDILMESASHDENAIEKAREVMESIGAKVVVIPYYPSQSSTSIKNLITKNDKNQKKLNLSGRGCMNVRRVEHEEF